ncbi:MAG: hypothetical protein JWQ08_1844 [Deinococcus sp.]|nr:hypothetical protein [Deinococcus sp.]
MQLEGGYISFELKILGYQFPNKTFEPYDSEWLSMQISIRHSEGRWADWVNIDPSLETVEIQWLIDWLREVASHSSAFKNWRSSRLESRMFFTEPNLGFEAHSNVYSEDDHDLALRVYLAAENLPPFKEDLNHALFDKTGEISEVWINFPVYAADLQRAALSLTEQLASFPTRTDKKRLPIFPDQGA